MPLALIAAVAGNDLVIGLNGDLPWHYSSDLKHFKNRTMGHTVVMGRLTYQSILNRLGKPLPGRSNFVLTHDTSFKDDRVTVLNNPQTIRDLAKQEEIIFIIGGASLYRLMLDAADILYITHIDCTVPGDSYFPKIDANFWQKTEEAVVHENGTKLRFCTYKRVSTA